MMNRWLMGGFSVLILAGASVTVGLLQRPAQAADVLAGLEMTVYKSATCDCCGGWIDAMRNEGIEIIAIDTDDIVSVKRGMSVPMTHYSCHTAEVGGYVVEGHVPVEALVDLMTHRPDIAGIALGGMPTGSPGMPGAKLAPFEIVAFDDASVSLFGRY